MLGLDLDDAKTISLIAVTVFVIGAIAALWFLQTLARKLLFSAIAVAFAFAIWSQREALVECADKVSESFTLADGNPALVDTDCTFFGTTVTISDPGSDDAAG